jgi:hypothetical protein
MKNIPEGNEKGMKNIPERNEKGNEKYARRK